MEKITLKRNDQFEWHAEKDGWILPLSNLVKNFDVYVTKKQPSYTLTLSDDKQFAYVSLTDGTMTKYAINPKDPYNINFWVFEKHVNLF